MVTQNRLQHDEKTREELLQNVLIQKTSHEDAFEIMRILCECFGTRNMLDAYNQLYTSNVDLTNSVKLVDSRDNKIYGVLVLGKHSITHGSPILHRRSNRILGKYLSKFKELNGFLFMIDERLRGTNLDKKMLRFNDEYIKQFDYVWCGVGNDFNTHNYWKKLGFVELFTIDDATFYVLNTKKNTTYEIFILKLFSEILKTYEDDNY